MKEIAIVGFGLSGAVFFINFINNIQKNKNPGEIRITLIDKIAVDGRGLAYRTPCNTNLLNTPSITMGLLSDNKMHFHSWLKNNYKTLLKSYSDFDFLYPPRNLYGEYIEATLLEHINIAERCGIKVIKRIDSVLSIQKKLSSYEISYEKHAPATYDYIVFATGGDKKNTLPSFAAHKNFFMSPYENTFPSAINTHGDVLILGTRLSAIDAALMLHKNGHKGKIYFVSRGGMLPRVQGPLHTLPRKHFTQNFIDSNERLSLAQIIEAIKNEIIYYEKKIPSLKTLKYPKGNAKSILRYEIIKSRSLRPWQNVLYTENHLVNLAWRKLSFEDKCKVNKRYTDYFSIYRAAMPLINAKKIYELMRQNQLEVLKNISTVELNEETGYFTTNVAPNRTISADYLIDATGISFDLSKTASPLYKAAQEHQLITINLFGGININGSTYEVALPNNEESPGLYALGGLSNGTDFGTNLAEYIINVSNNLCINLIEKLQKNEN